VAVEAPTPDDSITASEQASVGRRRSVVTRGMNVCGRNLLVSLYEDGTGERMEVRAFEAATVTTTECSIDSAAWARAGFGGRLEDLSAEERARLHEAIVGGIQVVELAQGWQVEVVIAAAAVTEEPVRD
jgi:hypothetical protein